MAKKAIVISKQTFKDSLASDLFHNGFLSPPHEIQFNEADSSIIFKTFIGHAESDVGDIYVMKIDKTGKTEVVAVESTDIGDSE